MRRIPVWLILLVTTFALTSTLVTAEIYSDSSGQPDTEQITNPQSVNADTTPQSTILFVKFKKGVQPAQQQSIASARGRVKEQMNDLVAIDYESGSLATIKQQLLQDPNVATVQEDVLGYPQVVVNDPSFTSQYAASIMRYEEAWGMAKTNQIVLVANPDTGIDSAHPDLVNILRPDLAYAIYLGQITTNTIDVYGHGTKTAGALAAQTNNSIGIASAPLNVQLVPTRITNDAGGAFDSDAGSAIRYLADNGVKVVSVSFGPSSVGSWDTRINIQSAGDYLESKGGLLFVSSGNAGGQLPPGNTPSIILVGGTDSNDNRASWSNYGPPLDLTAPGAGILTTTKGGGYGSPSGTSFAAPNAASVAALLFSTHPTATNMQIKEALFKSAKDLGTPGWDQYYGWGRVDAAAAMAYLDNLITPSPADTTPPSVPTNVQVGTVTTNSVSLGWTGSMDAESGVASYRVYRNGQLVGSPTANNYVDTGLQPSTTYNYKVAAVNGVGLASAQSTQVSATTQAVVYPTPSAVSNFRVTSTSASSANLAWDAASVSSGIIAYYIVRRNGALVQNSTSLTHTSNSLSSSTQYTFDVYAVSNFGVAGSLSTVIAQTTAPTPGGVSNLRASATTQTSTRLDWSAATNANAYEVKRDGDIVATPATTSFTDSALSAGTDYQYDVAATGAGGKGATSTVFVTTPWPTPSAPSNFRVTSQTATTVSLAWNADANAASYTIKRDGTTVATTQSTSITDSGRVPNQPYTYTVSGTNPDGVSGAASSLQVTLQGVPLPAPTALTASGVTATSATLAWNAVSGASGYRVWEANTVRVSSSPSRTYSASGLQAGTSYTFTVAAIDQYGLVGANSTVTFTTAQAAPSAPTGFVSGSVTESSALLSWNAASGAATYRVWQDGSVVVPSSTARTFSASGLAAGRAYTFAVAGMNSEGTVGPQTTLSVTTKLAPPPMPTGLVASKATSDGFTLTWDAVPGAATHRVWQGTTVVANDNSARTFVATGLQPNTQYTYKVAGINSEGTVGAQASVTATTTAAVLPAPATITVDSVSMTSASITWSAVSGAAGYRVRLDGAVVADSSSTRSYTANNLAAGTQYTLTVTTLNANGVESAPATASFTTTAVLALLPAPIGLTSSALTTSSAQLSWNAVNGATGYRVWQGNSVVAQNSASTSYAASGLTEGTGYTYKVAAINAQDAVGAQASTSFTTLYSSLASPAGLAASNVRSTSFDLDWNDVPNAEGYGVWVNDAYTFRSASDASVATLTPATQYAVRVAAWSATRGFSANASTSVTTAPANTAGPSGMSFSVTNSKVSFAWDADPDHAWYDVLRNNVVVSDNQAGTSFSDTSFQKSALVAYELRAFASDGTQRYTWTCTVAANDAGIVDASVTRVGDSGARLSWQSFGGDCVAASPPSFTVSRDGTSRTTTANTWFDDSELAAGSTYQYSITATVDGSARSPATISFTIPSPADVDSDGSVTMTDLNLVAAAVKSGDLTRDVNKDGVVNVYDIIAVAILL